jgi:hypothetical protein
MKSRYEILLEKLAAEGKIETFSVWELSEVDFKPELRGNLQVDNEGTYLPPFEH